MNKIKKIFACHGITKELYTDNGPEYTAQSFKRFAKEWHFKHVTSSPHFPQSNGLVERAIQTVKKSLKKAHEGNEDPYLTLLILNTTPGSDGASPAMRLINHQPRTTLPSLNLTDTSSPLPTIPKKVKKAYDQHAKDLTNIEPATVVRMRVQGEKRWDEIGKVVKKCQEPRAYRTSTAKEMLSDGIAAICYRAKTNSAFKMTMTIISSCLLRFHNNPNQRPPQPHLNPLMASRRNQVL